MEVEGDSNSKMLKFEIVSSRTVEGVDKEKKFVAYMLQVRQDSTKTRAFDPEPANVERRYTHFLDLYNGLRKDHPTLLNNVSFPRKVSHLFVNKLCLFLLSLVMFGLISTKVKQGKLLNSYKSTYNRQLIEL